MFGPEQLARTLDAALRDVKSEKERVRVSALQDLSRHAEGTNASAAIDAMAAALEGDPSPQVRGTAAIALADAGAKSALEAVLRGTRDENARVRQMALIALGELGDAGEPRVVDVVRDALRADDAALRFQSLIAASTLGLPFAEDALTRALHDDDSEIRHVAVRLLEERSTGDDASVRPSDAVLGAARSALDDASLRVRVAAAVLLARAGESASTRALVEAIAGRADSVDPEDLQAAIVLAGELGLADATAALNRHAYGFLGRGSRFAYEARIALAKMGHAKAKTSILRGLSALSRDARTLSVVAAGRANLAEALPLLEAMESDESRADSAAVSEALMALRGNAKA